MGEMSQKKKTAAGPRVDLHMHSTASDGRLPPAEVMAAAKEKGLAVVSLTDHDTLAGLEEAERAAGELELEFVPGVELAAYDEAGSTHLLGYFVDRHAAPFLEFLAEAQRLRIERAEQMVEKLNGLGMGVTMEEVLAQAGENGLVARPHIARALEEGGWTKSYREAFDRFIAAGRAAYVPTRHATPGQGIRLIQEAGGLAFLAHPGGSHDDDRIRELAELGLDGIEVRHPDHGPLAVERLEALAAELGLLRSGGSDWHGPVAGYRSRLATQPVPYEWYLELRRVAEQSQLGSEG